MDAALNFVPRQFNTAQNSQTIVTETLNKKQFVWKYTWHNQHLGNTFVVTIYGLLKDYCRYLMKYYAQHVKSLAGLPLRWITWLVLKLNFCPFHGTIDHLVTISLKIFIILCTFKMQHLTSWSRETTEAWCSRDKYPMIFEQVF